MTQQITDDFIEVDILDLKIIYEAMLDDVSRAYIRDLFSISREKARSRLERLVDNDIIKRKEICKWCGNEISECDCGRYSKKIFYHREPRKDEEEIMSDFIEGVEKINKIFNGGNSNE